ncbi:MAG: 2-oxoacid:acceptor oxidoreductase family protein [Desulfurococcaceae archaeon]
MAVVEIRWHGRAGQGAWTSSNLLAMAAAYEGKHVQSFPAFGPERSGAPMLAFTRISDDPIEVHSMIYSPDISVVLDETLVSPEVVEGLKDGGILVANFDGSPADLAKRLEGRKGFEVYVVPATKIALEILKAGITNTAVLGALLRARPLVKLESLEKAVRARFKGKLADLNLEVIRRAYDSTTKVSLP